MSNIFLKKNSTLPIFFLLLLAFFFLIYKIDKPFIGHHEFNGVFYSNIARNYLRYGFLKTKLGQVTNYGFVDPNEFKFHTYHPSFFPILLAIFFKIFGISEWSARLPVIIFSMGFLYIFNLILKRIYQLSRGYLAILLGIFTPLFLYYGRMPVFEPIITPFILLTIYFYFLWRKKQKRKYFFLILFSLLICQMIEWPGFYLSFILFLHNLIFPVEKKKRFLGFWWLAVAFTAFFIIVFHQFILTGQLKGRLVSSFIRRLTGNGGQPFTLGQFVRLKLARTRSFFTSTLLLLAFYWFINYCRKIFQKVKILPREHFVVFYLFFGVIHIIIFPNIAWYHDYMLYYFFPPILLSASLGLKNILSIAKSWQLLVFSIILLLVFWEKKQFLHDLRNLEPHEPCVIWGKEISKGLREPLIETDNIEEVRICPPFTNYYADEVVTFKLKETR